MTSPLTLSHTRSASLSCGTLPQQDACALQRSVFLSSTPPPPPRPMHTHTPRYTYMHFLPPRCSPLLFSSLCCPSALLSSLLPQRLAARAPTEPQSGTPLRLPLRRGEDEREEGREKDQRRRNERPDKVTKPLCCIRQEGCSGGGNKKLCCQEITARQVWKQCGDVYKYATRSG